MDIDHRCWLKDFRREESLGWNNNGLQFWLKNLGNLGGSEGLIVLDWEQALSRLEVLTAKSGRTRGYSEILTSMKMIHLFMKYSGWIVKGS